MTMAELGVESSASLHVAPIGEVGFPAFAALFDAAGSACFCQFWHFAGLKNDWLAELAHGGPNNRIAAKHAHAQHALSGLVASAAGRVVGWLKLEPKPQLSKITRQSVYRKAELPRSASILIAGCMLVDPAWRGRGVARELLQAAPKYARSIGASAIEAYPRMSTGRLHDEEAFMGPASVFEELGFVQVAGETPYPILRLDLD